MKSTKFLCFAFDDTDDKLADDVTLKNIVILILHVFKNEDKFYEQIFLEEALWA